MTTATAATQTEQTENATNPLAIVESTPGALMYEGTKLDAILKEISRQALSLVPDLSTEKGRKAIASNAYQVSRSKTLIDDKGKNLVADIKAQAKRIDDQRKHARDTLDALRDKVRAPLDAWEAKRRDQQQAIDTLNSLGKRAESSWGAMAAADIEATLAATRELQFDPTEWTDPVLAANARFAKVSAIKGLEIGLEARRKYDAEQAELARLREAQAELERRQAEEEAKAKLRAEIEADIAKKEKADYIRQMAEKNARAAHNAIDRAAEAEEAAILGAKAPARGDEELERRRVVHQAMLRAFMAQGLDEWHARNAVTAIKNGLIPHISINYNEETN